MLSASTITDDVEESKIAVSGDRRIRWLATIVLFETVHRRISFSPGIATKSGGRVIVSIPYQLLPSGTIRTMGGFFAITGGAVRNGLKVTEPVMRSPWPPGLFGLVGPVGDPQ
jgi:hypothetical protein